ncbi:acyl-CoA dehydrogenase family protein [Nocardioides sp.]|uniref:acyl-CoA dehydrogenase family protein n=1 Tax=Nocardioides sp. TaxID=35761 RepID=UPI002611CD1B|nr:acyl-CoA dehydrogenase family protein [Nocardioides sp.]
MRLVPTTEERDLAAMLRALFGTHWSTTDVRALREPGADRFPRGLWERLAGAGICGIAVPEEHGGAGGTLSDVGVVAVEAGRALCPSVVLGTIGLAYALGELAGPDQRGRLLPALAAGDLRGVAVLASPSDTRDLTPRLRATREGEGWRVAGSLPDVVDADLADLILATALTEDGTVLGVLLPPAATVCEERPTTAGDRHAAVAVEAVLGADEVLGAGAGLDPDDLARVAQALQVIGCLELVGVTEAIVDRTVEYTLTREQFGRPIASFQAAQHLVANMRIALAAARLTSHSAAAWLGRGGVEERRTAIAVMQAAAAARRASLDAHQLHGGMGYVLETDLHLWSERARELGVLGGGGLVAAGWLADALVAPVTEEVRHG